MQTVHTLSNGVTVVLCPNTHSSAASVLVGVSVGSIYESSTQYGLAHFFEHMCFKGTQKYPSSKGLVSTIDGEGLLSNAYTDRGCTVYHLTGSAEKIESMLHLTADIFLHSLFQEEELEKEKGVILSEIAMYEDDPSYKSMDVIEKYLLEGTPAEHSILGSIPLVKEYTRDDFLSFFQKYYIAENTTVCVSGNIDTKKVLKRLESLYADIPRGNSAKHHAIELRNPMVTHTSIVRSDLEQTHISIGGMGPALQEKEWYALKVAGVLLGGSMSSRLFLSIREQLGACYSIHFGIDSQPYGSLGYIYLATSKKYIEKAMEGITSEMRKVKDILVDEEELQKAKNIILGAYAVRQEQVYIQGNTVLSTWLLTKELHQAELYKKAIASVTKEEVQQVIQKAYAPEKLSVCYVGREKIDEKVTQTFLQAV